MAELELAAKAERLRALHHGPGTAVFPNAWDAHSARLVEQAGFGAVATSSGASARMLGRDDGETMTPDEAFAAVGLVTRAVSLPVTADMEGGYGLDADEFVARLLDAGAVGCNYEDTDHSGVGTGLVAAEVQVERLAQVKAAGRRARVDIVLNARVDTFVRAIGSPAEQLDEAVRRGRMYLEAGADCVYPIAAPTEADIRRLVAEIPGPINAMLRPGAPPLPKLQELGVARVTLASGLYRVAMGAVENALEDLIAASQDAHN